MSDDIAITPCPDCQAVGSLQITVELVAQPIGDFSLAGGQMKVSAVQVPVLECEECGFVRAGTFDGDGHVLFGSS